MRMDVETRLFVGNLPFATTERELRDVVAVHAGVEKVEIARDRFSQQSKGFAFVELISGADAQATIEAMNGTKLDGRELTVQIAKPREDRSERNGSGRRDDRRGFRN
jgi:cold-inducible RNA-binding protein